MGHNSSGLEHHDETTSDGGFLSARSFVAKAKEAFHTNSSNTNNAHQKALQQLDQSPAFNPRKFLNSARIGKSGIPDKAIAFIQGTAQAITDPKAAIKHHATRKTALKLAKSRPYLSKKADLDFLEAHDSLSQAESKRQAQSDGVKVESVDGDINHCTEHIVDMERAREEMRVAWVTTRHVQRVRAIDAIHSPPFPKDKFFEEEDNCGYIKFSWGEWIAHKLLYGSYAFTAQYIDDFTELPFDLDTLRKHVERLIIVSAPLQEMILEVRRIYRWENYARTGRWMALYFFLWYISHIMTFWYGYIIYSVIMNYYYPHSLEEVREGIRRTLDRGATALKVGELMDKHGSDDWLGPLLEELGPYIQLQIADLASFLEACYNFYHFRSPSATAHSLCLFGSIFLISALGDSRFALKIFWLITGLVFFACWPISSLYPQYRLVVSPFKWTLWNVPNHEEWSFDYLQNRSAEVRKMLLASQNSTSNLQGNADADMLPDIHDISTNDNDKSSFKSIESRPSDEKDIIKFPCTFHNVPGHLVVSTEGLRFSSGANKMFPHVTFHKRYLDLVEMSKLQADPSILRPLAKVTTGLNKLELRFRNNFEEASADIMLLENMRGRDKAFNAIIGFSQVRWQHLQKRRPQIGKS